MVTSARINGPILHPPPGGRNGEQVRIGSPTSSARSLPSKATMQSLQASRIDRRTSPGEAVHGPGHPLTVELGPWPAAGYFRRRAASAAGDRQHCWRQYPARAAHPFADRERLAIQPDRRPGAGRAGRGGTRLGTVQETETIEHRILVHSDGRGELIDLAPAGNHARQHDRARS